MYSRHQGHQFIGRGLLDQASLNINSAVFAIDYTYLLTAHYTCECSSATQVQNEKRLLKFDVNFLCKLSQNFITNM